MAGRYEDGTVLSTWSKKMRQRDHPWKGLQKRTFLRHVDQRMSPLKHQSFFSMVSISHYLFAASILWWILISWIMLDTITCPTPDEGHVFCILFIKFNLHSIFSSSRSSQETPSAFFKFYPLLFLFLWYYSRGSLPRPGCQHDNLWVVLEMSCVQRWNMGGNSKWCGFDTVFSFLFWVHKLNALPAWLFTSRRRGLYGVNVYVLE